MSSPLFVWLAYWMEVALPTVYIIVLTVSITLIQRPKNPYSKLALLSGKILRVRKKIACMRKKLF